MKTVVEWLEDNLISEPWTEEHFKHNSECWDKANKMFEEQIIEAWVDGVINWDSEKESQQYYNETFKSE